MAKSHKYIKREWKNGRWQYTYADDEMLDGKKRKYLKTTSGHHTSKSKYGTYKTADGNHTLTVKKSDKLFTTKSGNHGTYRKIDPKTGKPSEKKTTNYSNVTINEGKIARGDTKVQKKTKKIKKRVAKGKRYIQSYLNK